MTVLKGHTDVVTSVTWNGWMLVSASKNGTVKLWQLDKDFEDNLLDKLLVYGCSWLNSYLENNPLVSKDDRDLCDGISIDRGEAGTAQVAPKEPVTGAAASDAARAVSVEPAPPQAAPKEPKAAVPEPPTEPSRPE